MSGAPVTIAVVSYGTRGLLDRCLTSLGGAVEQGLAEVWVVDNASPDGSAELVAERHPWAELIASRENLGFGPAVNRVYDRTTSEWLVAANADVVIDAAGLETLLAVGRCDPRVGALAPSLSQPGGEPQHSVHPFPGPGLAAGFGLGIHRLVPGLGERLLLEGAWNPRRRRMVGWAHGALLMFRREAFAAAGGFDPEQWMYAEDIDIAWRLRRAGWRTRYVPEVVVGHEVSAATSEAFGPERTERHIAATQRWLARRRSPLAARAFSAASALGAVLRWPHARLHSPEAAAMLRRHARAQLAGIRDPARPERRPR